MMEATPIDTKKPKTTLPNLRSKQIHANVE